MERYVDGFLLPLRRDAIDAYKAVAGRAGAIWKEHGALEYWECIADDLEPHGMVSFRQSAGAREDETVIFSFIVYESREQRDRVNAAVMSDPRITGMMESGDHPFDYRRMAYGGFRELVRL